MSDRTQFLCDSCRFNLVSEEGELCANCMTADDNGFFVNLSVDLRIRVPSVQEAERISKIVRDHICNTTNQAVQDSIERDVETEVEEIEFTKAKEYGS